LVSLQKASAFVCGLKERDMAKVACVLDDDLIGRYSSHARDALPHIGHCPDGLTLPRAKAIGFVSDTLLGRVSGGRDRKSFLENLGHSLLATPERDGLDSVFRRELSDAEIVISQLFRRTCLIEDRFVEAKKLELAGTGTHSCRTADTTRGSVEAVLFKKCA
jgi:formate dehydrogenase